MKIGDLVVVTGVPSALPDGMGTRELFAKCLGRTFAIAGFENGLVELKVGEVLGERGEVDRFHALIMLPSGMVRQVDNYL